MISLEQIRQLDTKVQGAISLIQSLRKENAALKQKLDDYTGRIAELEKLITDFKEDQGEIEQGILQALTQLDSLESELPREMPESGETSPVTEEAEEEPQPAESDTREAETDTRAEITSETEDSAGASVVAETPPLEEDGDDADGWEPENGESEEEEGEKAGSELDIF